MRKEDRERVQIEVVSRVTGGCFQAAAQGDMPLKTC